MSAFRILSLLCLTFSWASASETDVFQLKPPPPVLSQPAEPVLDVDLGESPAEFTAACWKQLTGKRLDSQALQKWAAKLGTPEAPRRIDLALLLAAEAGVHPRLKYSDPWQAQPDLPPAPARQVKRQVGAVLMFFFHCPNDPNGSIHWCNNHVAGMDQPSPLYGFGEKSSGYYNREQPGFWDREICDANAAGLSFLLLNCYGPDWQPPVTDSFLAALKKQKSESNPTPMKFALFDDTWAWGKPFFGDSWKQAPDLSQTETAAKTLYEAKWKPFFSVLPRDAWFLVKGHPLIYFYNAGTLVPKSEAGPVIEKMKQFFAADFGVEPFVAVDRAFFEDERMPQIADAKFQWMTLGLPEGFSLEMQKGVTLAHAMVRWDSISRENGSVERVARPGDRLLKDDRALVRVLNATRDADLLVLATWNDLGEGTGINRCYDYYWDGQWKTPDHFMKLILRSQAGETLR